MGALGNGTVTILAEDRKAIDIKITNAFPLIALEPVSWHVASSGLRSDISGFQHFSIPPDLTIHFSKPKRGATPAEHLFFKAPELNRLISDSCRSPQILFTYVGCPIRFCKKFSGKWYGAAIISPFKDAAYDIFETRVFIDFFIHTNPDQSGISIAPLVLPQMRLAYDRTGCTLGPFSYQGIQRKSQRQPNLLSTIRYGYINVSDDQTQSCYILTSYDLPKS